MDDDLFIVQNVSKVTSQEFFNFLTNERQYFEGNTGTHTRGVPSFI